jgi:ATP-dependent DNA ligase
MKTTTLYKVDNNGAIRVWGVSTHGSQVITTAGILNGAMTTTTYHAEPTNIGRSNERTSSKQALFEAKALLKKQKRLGYYDTIEKASKNVATFKSVKLHKVFDDEGNYTKYFNNLPDQIVIERKHDGVNLSVKRDKDGNVTFRSRGVTTFDIMHETKFAHVFDSITPNVWYVGELTAEDAGYRETDIGGAAKAKTLKDKHVPMWDAATFIVFDVWDEDGGYDNLNNLDYIERMEWVAAELEYYNVKHVEVVEYEVINKAHFERYYNEFLDKGYEGAVVRTVDAAHECGKRSSVILKAKPSDTEDFVIKDISVTNKGQVIFDLGDFTATYNATKESQRDIYYNRYEYVGLIACVRSNGTTSTGLPKFPKIINIVHPSIKGK